MTRIPSRCYSMLIASMFFCTVVFAGKTLVYCSEGSPDTFNPQLSTSGTTFDASSRQIYNRLYEFKLGTTEVIPGLAESVTISEDGKIYTFKLRRGVKFHKTDYFTPTRDFTAEDVLFSFNRQRLGDHPYAKISNVGYPYYGDMAFPKLIQDIRKMDDYTVQFILTKVESPFLADLAMDFASILSAEYADHLLKAGTPDQIDQKPIGTGPFVFKSYKKDAVIRYNAHPDYWKGKEKIDSLVFAITTDPTVRYAKLRAGECHVSSNPLPNQLAAMRTNPEIVVQEQPGLNIGYWAFNTKKKPLDDKRVRIALSHAVNKKAILEAVYNHTAQSAKNFIPPTIWSYNNATKDYPYDLEKAKKLLTEAGYPNGFEIDLWAMPVQRPYNPDARKMAELMQQDLLKLGIKAKIVSYEWGTFLNKARAGEHQTILSGWSGDNGDPDNFFTPLLSCDAAQNGGNFSFWCHPPFDTLILKAKAISNIAKRTELYKKAQLVFKEEAPSVTIAHAVRFQAYRKTVKGLVLDPLGGIYFSGVALEN